MEKRVYRFRDFELEPDERRLSEAGKSVALTPKVFDTLVLLVERSGHVVSKDELMRLLWPRGYVDESNLTKHIWLIRRALGEGDHDSRFIETVPKLGYRFVAPVTTTGSPPPEAPDATRSGATLPANASLPAAPASVSELVPAVARGPAARARLALLALGVLAALMIVIAWRLTTRPTAAPLAGQPGRAGCCVCRIQQPIAQCEGRMDRPGFDRNARRGVKRSGRLARRAG